MKKLLLVCLLLTGWSQAQNITFKDPAFKNYLVNYEYYGSTGLVKLDLNNDGEISVDELSIKVKRASELIKICKNKQR